MKLEKRTTGRILKTMHTPYENNVVITIDYYEDGKVSILVNIYAYSLKPNPYPIDYLTGTIILNDDQDLEEKIRSILVDLRVPAEIIAKIMEES